MHGDKIYYLSVEGGKLCIRVPEKLVSARITGKIYYYNNGGAS